MEDKPNYYAIIPAEVRYDPDLRANEKLFFGEIVALSNISGICTASNNYFSKLYNVVPSAISKWVKDLEEKQYISVEYVKKGKEITERKLIITGIHKYDKVFTKVVEGYSQKLKENNTSINNTSIKEKEQEEKENTIFDFIQSEFGRTLSPTEYEYISQWEDNDLTRYAIKQAILNNAPRIKYIQAILDSYKSKNIKSVSDAQEEERKFKNKGVPEWLGKEIIEEENEDAKEFARRIREYHKEQEKS